MFVEIGKINLAKAFAGEVKEIYLLGEVFDFR